VYNYLLKLLSDDTQLQIGNILNIKLTDIQSIIYKGIKIILTIALMYIAIIVGKYLINKFVKKQIESNAILSLDTQRAKTLGEVLKSVLKYSVYFMGIAIIISIIFKEISLTFASIGGIVVGLGAQSLIKDLINGFFILFENQFGVGDHVTIGSYNGIVKSIGIRATVITDFTGDVHSIPNGSIMGVTNHSRNDIRFTVDISISNEENIEDVISIIKTTCDEFKSNNEEFISEPIEIKGIIALELTSSVIRITGKARPLMQWKMENELRMSLKLALDKNKICISEEENI
jgi:small conductance mechanosensitive channel